MDIVERLHRAGRFESALDHTDCLEAAEAIRKLRATQAKILDGAHNQIKALQAENERLREQLQRAERFIALAPRNFDLEPLRAALGSQREYDPNVAPCDDAEFGMKP